MVKTENLQFLCVMVEKVTFYLFTLTTGASLCDNIHTDSLEHMTPASSPCLQLVLSNRSLVTGAQVLLISDTLHVVHPNGTKFPRQRSPTTLSSRQTDIPAAGKQRWPPYSPNGRHTLCPNVLHTELLLFLPFHCLPHTRRTLTFRLSSRSVQREID